MLLFHRLSVLFCACMLPGQVSWDRVSTFEERSDTAVAADSARGRLVLFGGAAGTQRPLGDTWEWDGSVWTHRPTASAPSARAGHAMAYDARRGRTVLFGGAAGVQRLADTWEWDGASWTLANPAQSPSPRRGHAMHFDAARGVTLLFGGFLASGMDSDETWQWDGVNWTQLQPAQSPSPRGAHSLGSDGRIVLFGGRDGAATILSDTWEWDSAALTWRRLFTAGPITFSSGLAFGIAGSPLLLFAPSPTVIETWRLGPTGWTRTPVQASLRNSFATAFDGQKVALIGGVDSAFRSTDTTFLWDGVGWQLGDPLHKPTGRSEHAIAWDGVSRAVLLFGGASRFDDAMSDTWSFDGARWRFRPVPQPPPGRTHHGLAWHAARREVVMFGGIFEPIVLDDTWVWDGANWLQRTPAVHPSARSNYAMVDQTDRGRVLLFGGEDLQRNYLDDTWEWDGVTWTQRSPTRRPPRFDHLGYDSMTYDAARGLAVLVVPSPTGNQTWEWDGNDWSQRPATNANPYGSLQWDGARQRIVMLDAAPAGFPTWEWDGSWLFRLPAVQVPFRDGPATAFDPLRRRLVVFGGSVQAKLGDTWEYGPVDPAHVVAFGQGCAPSGGPTVGEVVGRGPWIGAVMDIQATDLPGPGTSLAMFLGPPLGPPFDLGPLGMTACLLYTDPLLAVPLTAANGVATLRVAVPDDRALIGQLLSMQAAVLDPGANPFGVTTSNAVLALFGAR